MTELSYRPADESDAPSISELVLHALDAETLPGWTPHAVSSLLAKASPDSMRGQIASAAFAHVAVDGKRVVGFILCKQLRFLNLLVVEPNHQRQGIGSNLTRRMFQNLLAAAPDLSVVEVNATEHSLSFWRRVGFYPLSEFIEFDGCRFARLGYWRKNPRLPQPEC